MKSSETPKKLPVITTNSFNRLIFKLPWLFLLHVITETISLTALVLCCSSLNFFVPRHFLRPYFVKPKRGNLKVYIVYIYICASASLVGLVSSSSFNILLSLKQCEPATHGRPDQEQKILFNAEPAGSDFRLFGFFGDQSGQEFSLRVFVLI